MGSFTNLAISLMEEPVWSLVSWSLRKVPLYFNFGNGTMCIPQTTICLNSCHITFINNTHFYNIFVFFDISDRSIPSFLLLPFYPLISTPSLLSSHFCSFPLSPHFCSFPSIPPFLLLPSYSHIKHLVYLYQLFGGIFFLH